MEDPHREKEKKRKNEDFVPPKKKYLSGFQVKNVILRAFERSTRHAMPQQKSERTKIKLETRRRVG